VSHRHWHKGIRCIYCGQAKRPDREHVIPRNLGTYRNLEHLNRHVCRACNGKLSPLDQISARTGPEALFRHIAGPPIYLIDDEWPTRAEYDAWLHDPQVAVWIAEPAGEAIGFLTIGPAVQDACTIIRDEGTASVIAAFTVEEVRGKGVATGLLNRALGWAKDQGYERCAVDFEPMNPQARRFWTRHFDCVAYTVVRHMGAFEGRDGGPGTGDG